MLVMGGRVSICRSDCPVIPILACSAIAGRYHWLDGDDQTLGQELSVMWVVVVAHDRIFVDGAARSVSDELRYY